MTNFCRAGNLKALLKSQKMPASLEPLLPQLQALNTPMPAATQIPSTKTRRSTIDGLLFEQLVDRLNELFPEPGCKWIASDKWAQKKKSEAKTFLPVNSSINNCACHLVDNLLYSTFKSNPSNSCIALWANLKAAFGIIDQIFQHLFSADHKTRTHTWFVLKPLNPLPHTDFNPFAYLSKYHMQTSLKVLDKTVRHIIHSDEIMSHCAWLEYGPREVSPKITTTSMALVSLDRGSEVGFNM